MKQHIYFLIAILVATVCTAMETMEEDGKIIEPRFCLFPFDEEILVAGKNGWNIFDPISRQSYVEIQKSKIQDVAMNEEILALATESDTKDYYLYIHAKEENKINIKWICNSSFPFKPIIANNHTVLCYNKDELQLYDYRDEEDINFSIPYNSTAIRSPLPFPLISSHPTKLEFIYPSSKKTLSIIQPYHETSLKMKLKTNFLHCNGGEYNPNGTMLAIKANDWQYFIYDIERDDSYAYEIGDYHITYISSAFHPHLYISFLLSEDNIIEGWDYLRRLLLFTTYPLANPNHAKINYRVYSKRLACSPDGTKLLVALKNDWKIIDIPQKNNLSCVDMSEFFQLNRAAFSNVAKLPPIRGGVDLSKEAVVPTEYRKITAVYNTK